MIVREAELRAIGTAPRVVCAGEAAVVGVCVRGSAKAVRVALPPNGAAEGLAGSGAVGRVAGDGCGVGAVVLIVAGLCRGGGEEREEGVEEECAPC